MERRHKRCIIAKKLIAQNGYLFTLKMSAFFVKNVSLWENVFALTISEIMSRFG
jgi:hypothetical protein